MIRDFYRLTRSLPLPVLTRSKNDFRLLRQRHRDSRLESILSLEEIEEQVNNHNQHDLVVRKILERSQVAEALLNMSIVEIVTAGLSDCWTLVGD